MLCFFYFGIGGVDEASKFQAIPVAVSVVSSARRLAAAMVVRRIKER